MPVELEQGLATCPYCKSSLFISLREGYLHFIIAPVLKEMEIEKTLHTYLERRERKGRLKIIAYKRVYWPFWRIQEGDKLHTFIASTHPVTNLEKAEIPSGDAKPFSENEMKDEIVEPPGDQLEDLVEREGIIATKTWLMHLPFWVVEYEYDGVTYEAWLDAVRGRVFVDDLPPAFEKKKDTVYAAVALSAFAIFFIIGVAIPNANIALLVYAVSALPVYYGIKYVLKEVMS